LRGQRKGLGKADLKIGHYKGQVKTRTLKNEGCGTQSKALLRLTLRRPFEAQGKQECLRY
jgi:hypothetical protein